ncbi:hypothetical protein BGZ75_004550 [Mortierella antarctica]|nr:hypothetical protein BGZ75_004550 [Mortierella antarctica]
MSSSAPSVKDLYKTVTADLAAFVNAERPQDTDPIHAYLDRFIKTNTPSHGSTPSTPSGSTVHTSTTAQGLASTASAGAQGTQGAQGGQAGIGGHGGHGGHGGAGPQGATASTPGALLSPSTSAAGQRHANELWYQSLANPTALQHSSNLPFAFHRLGSPTTNSPTSSGPTSQNASVAGSPVISGGNGTGAAVPLTASSHIASGTGLSIASASNQISLAAQRFSAHLISLFSQYEMGETPIASVASRIIVYLTHLLPFLTPQLVISDWWHRLIEPSLQGEIRLEKDSLKACRDLVTECMVRDPLMDPLASGAGSLLVAGDEEGQLSTPVAMAAMPIPQFVLRKYIRAARKLNHRLEGLDLHAEGTGASWLRAKGSSTLSSGHAGHESGSGLPFTRSTSSTSNNWQSEYPPVLQDLENQQRLLSKARAIIRRKKDLLAKNLESILFTYGGGVGRVKDFFSCLYTYFVGARYRAEILGLLCQFIRRQRVHLHQILATPLFDSILLSLKHDTSPLIISLGLMTLIMLMPRIPATLNDRLPDLFLILSRILCWPKSQQQLLAVTSQDGTNLTGQTIRSFDEFDDEGVSTNRATENGAVGAGTDDKTAEVEAEAKAEVEVEGPPNAVESEDIPLYSHGIRWRRYGPAVPGGTKEGAPDPTAIFSFLYGLFPCNLLQFLHSPRRYLSQSLSPTGSPKQGSGVNSTESDEDAGDVDGGSYSPKETAGSDDKIYIDEDLLKSRVQTMLKRHSLHPDLLTMTCEQELVNKARWQKLEPMEIVAMCVGLDVWSAGGLYGTGPILRSIEEEKGGLLATNSDEEDEDNEIESPPTSQQSTDQRTSPVQAQASASVESLGSEASEGTPIEILAQEEFFGPRAVREAITPSRPLPGTTLSAFQRAQPLQQSISGPGVHTLPRTRKKSKEVRMSQILQNFATLRGLNHDEYLAEAASTLSLTVGPGGVNKDRRGSALKNRSSSGSLTATTATHPPGDATLAAPSIVTDIPTEKSMALTITNTGSTQNSLQHATSVATLVMLNQEYRRTVMHLERDLLMAKNELNFELFLKQQHIQQISKVHRAHVLDASVEAERQNLYNTCRSLKAQLQDTRLLLEKEKSELEKRKNKQTHWDTELKSKMQTFRDERKQLQFEVERLKQDIKDTKQAQETQERLLTEERKGTFQLKNSIEDLSPKLKRMEEYETQIQEMTRQLVLWETEQSRASEMQHQVESVFSQWQKAEQLLAAEREESRTLRNKASQQAQILDDLRLQMTINEGRTADDMSETPPMEYQSEEEAEDRVEAHDGGGEADKESARLDQVVENEHGSEDEGSQGQEVERERSIRRKASNSLRHRNSSSALDASHWPSTYSRSSSSQTGVDQQRRAEAMQGFLAREKERWDQELQQAHNRWSKEATRNQELEDRILELQGQLEMAQAMDRRPHPGWSHQDRLGDSLGQHGGDGGSDSSTPLIHVPSQPQDVPNATATHSTASESGVHDDTEGADTDDGGIGSSGMIGRYSRQRQETEDEDDLVAQRMRSTQRASAQVSTESLQSKGKGTKSSKSKSRWPSILERAQTDKGAYTTSMHLGGNAPGFLDLTRHPPSTHRSQSSQHLSRKSGESSSTRTTASSSSAAARAAAGGLIPVLDYHPRKMSTMSDGASSDMTTASDSSATASAQLQAAGSSAGEESSRTGGKKGAKAKTKKEQERERERIRMMSGVGPLVDPSKMYRNVRMF